MTSQFVRGLFRVNAPRALSTSLEQSLGKRKGGPAFQVVPRSQSFTKRDSGRLKKSLNSSCFFVGLPASLRLDRNVWFSSRHAKFFCPSSILIADE